MIAYFDTSALVKRVIQEPGSEHAERVWRDVSTVVSNGLLSQPLRSSWSVPTDPCATPRRSWAWRWPGSGADRDHAA
jgi:hypothetical protein